MADLSALHGLDPETLYALAQMQASFEMSGANARHQAMQRNGQMSNADAMAVAQGMINRKRKQMMDMGAGMNRNMYPGFEPSVGHSQMTSMSPPAMPQMDALNSMQHMFAAPSQSYMQPMPTMKPYNPLDAWIQGHPNRQIDVKP